MEWHELWDRTPETTVPGHSAQDRCLRYQPAGATGRCPGPYALARAVLISLVLHTFSLDLQRHRLHRRYLGLSIHAPVLLREDCASADTPPFRGLAQPSPVFNPPQSIIFLALSLSWISILPSLKGEGFPLLLPTSNISGKGKNSMKFCL